MSVEGPTTQPGELNLYQQIIDKSQRAHRLLTAHWELTYRCNERCTHCYLDVLPPNVRVPEELTTAECLRVIDELVALGTLNVSFSGGEILVRRDFFEIAEYARSRHLLLRLFTNGIRVTPALADRIAALHPYDVELSLYSVHAETHDRITQLRHSWELTIRAIRLLRARGVRTLIKTPLMRENVREIKALKALAQELNAQFHYDITVTAKDSGRREPLKHRLTYEDLVWLMNAEIDVDRWSERPITETTRTCGIGLAAAAIDPYGNIYPCVQTRLLAGNVRTQSLRQIWTESPIWRELGNLTSSELPICRACQLRTLCVRCHGLAFVEHGDLRAPARVNCREALARREVLIDKGFLPADFPIPEHLQELARRRSEPDEIEARPTQSVTLATDMPAPHELAVGC